MRTYNYRLLALTAAMISSAAVLVLLTPPPPPEPIPTAVPAATVHNGVPAVWPCKTLTWSSPDDIASTVERSIAAWAGKGRPLVRAEKEEVADIVIVHGDPAPGAEATTLLDTTYRSPLGYVRPATHTITLATITVGNTYNHLENLLIHEMGHALGLGHAEAASIMTPVVSSGATITQADTSTLDSLYRHCT